MSRGLLNAELICLIFLLSSMNLKFVFAHKCEYELLNNNYMCRIKSGSRSDEQHVTGKDDNDVIKTLFDGTENNISLLTESEFPFCQWFKNLEEVEIETINTVDGNVLQNCINLKKVVIQHSKVRVILESLFSENLKIKSIGLSWNGLTTLPENLFSNQKELEYLDLDRNKIIYLPSNIFKSLKNLRRLWLNYNKIQTLNPAWFKNLANLERLEMISNEISDLPKNVFSSLINLKYLELSVNNISAIHSDSFGMHIQAMKVDFSGNKINAIDEKFIDNPAINEADFSENPCIKGSFYSIFGKDSKAKARLKECFDNYQPRNEQVASLWNLLDMDDYECGKPKMTFPQIFYGFQVKHGEHPWNAALFHRRHGLICGGTLISSKLIVTAAHCIEGKRGQYIFEPKYISIVLGAHNISQSHERGKITLGVNAAHVHHDWNPYVDSYDADIAILELEEEVNYSRYIQPICLAQPGSESALKNIGYVTGFGKSERSNIEDIARFVSTPIRSYRACGSNSSTHQSLLSNRAFCGGFANGTGVCTGDSGSGLIVVHDNVHYLRGIVSASLGGGIEGCNLREYSIFADILGFYGWIRTGKDDKILIRELLEENRRLKANNTGMRRQMQSP